jgi:hypothetical protein
LENDSEEIERVGRWEVEKMGNKEDKKLESFDSPNLSSLHLHNFWLIKVSTVFIKQICAI